METAILLALQSVRVPGITELMALFSALGNMGFIWIVIGLICLFFSEKRQTGICIFLTIAIVYIVAELILDPMVARVRPCDAGIGVNAVVGVSHSGYSFPSGHTTISFAVAMVICMMSESRKSKFAAVFLAIIIAFSRLYLGVHYPTDVLAGMVIGIVIAVIVVGIWRAFLGQLFLSLFGLTAQKLSGSSAKTTSAPTGNIHRRSISENGSHSKAKKQKVGNEQKVASKQRAAKKQSAANQKRIANEQAQVQSSEIWGSDQHVLQEKSNYDREHYTSRLSKSGAHSRKRSGSKKKRKE